MVCFLANLFFLALVVILCLRFFFPGIFFPEKLSPEILCLFPSILECPVNAFMGPVPFSVVYDGPCLKCLTLMLFQFL